jgi:PPOX class probable F420-dependent enzyme
LSYGDRVSAKEAKITSLNAAGLQFLTERHLATLATLRPDGSPHLVPVGFTWDPAQQMARVITSATSRKARNSATWPEVALCQLDGRRWLTLEGTATVTDGPVAVGDAVARYAHRYRAPRENPTRVVIEIAVRRLLGSAEFFD